MDISLFSVLNNSLGAIREIGGTMISIRDEARLTALKIELTDQILAAHEAMFALQNEREQLKMALAKAENELAELKDQSAQLEQYELFRSRFGAWLYRAKGTDGDGVQSPAWCAHCFESKQLTVLQSGTGEDRNRLVCLRCGAKHRNG